MEAYEAREKSIKPQLDMVLSQIQEATEEGQNLIVVDGIDGIGIVYPEVAEQLIEMGYDVWNLYNPDNPFEAYTAVIWQFAEKGVKGRLTDDRKGVWAEETNPEPEYELEEWQLELQKELQKIIPKDDGDSLVEDAKGLMAAIKAENEELNGDMHPYSFGDFCDFE